MAEYARMDWMGRKVKVHFAPTWPVPIGNYEYQGFDERGIWVLHWSGSQRHILWCDIDKVELRDET